MIWAQIEDNRVTTIPPDGTIVEVFAEFTFSGLPLPDGSHVQFLIGKGEAPDEAKNVKELEDAISPLAGIEFFDEVGIVETRFIRDEDGVLAARSVASARIKPVTDLLKDNVTVIAYSTFDKLGTAKRLTFGSTSLTVSGGEGIFLGSVERYSPTENTWAEKASMGAGRSGPFCATVSLSGDKIYAIGGFNGNFTGVCEQYDPAIDAWITKTSLPVQRGFGATAVVANKIYAIGGYDFGPGRASTAMHVYDPSADTWTELASLPFPLAFSTAQTVGTNIWVFYGGIQFSEKDKPEVFNSAVLKYDTLTDEWEISDSIYSGAVTGIVSDSEALGSFSIRTNALVGISGCVTLNRGQINQETVRYLSNEDGLLLLAEPLVFAHSSGETVHDASLPRTRMGANSYFDGSDKIKIFNGFGKIKKYDGRLEEFTISTKTSVLTSGIANLPRNKAGSCVSGTTSYVISGSAEKSDYLGDVEAFNVATNAVSGPAGLTRLTVFRTSAGVVAASDGASTGIYAIGGQGSGHPPGWLKMDVETSPETIRADGRETSSVLVNAVDAGGNPPTDGTLLKVRGLIYIPKEQAKSEDDAEQERVPSTLISILPVLFSSREIELSAGTGGTILLDRSEDLINEVENLLSFVKKGEDVLNQAELKKAANDFSNAFMTVGEDRELYSIAVEIFVDDPFYFGQTDSEATANDVADVELASEDFSFNPPAAQQGMSGKVGFYSDVASIPAVQKITAEPVDLVTLEGVIDVLKEEIPFGASPHFDALVSGAQARILPDPEAPLLPPSNMTVSVSDNENSGSASSAADVVDETNLVAGVGRFPVFVTTVIVTDPISLAARKARTDVSDLELISDETGGNSFSLDDPGYVNFIIDRIKTSAPASIGSGTVAVQHEIDGALSSISFVVTNMIAGNSASLTARYSQDGYNFIDLDFVLNASNGSGPITSTYAFSTPVSIKILEYTVLLGSKSFDSPVLGSVTIKYIEPNVKYLFTYPQTVSGQVSELAAAINHALPSGGEASLGFTHGESTEFDRDFTNPGQPSVNDRGTIMAVNRAFDAIVDDFLFRDILDSDDFMIYRSRSGPWAQEAIVRVFINQIEALPAAYVSVPEEGKIVFRRRLDFSDIVSVEIENPARFRVGIKITNPTLLSGTMDSFAFMWGETEATEKFRPNRPPMATNLFISPSPAIPGGPLTANYTFVDPDGDSENLDETQIVWFRNGSPITELKNKRIITNSDLNATRADSNDGLISRGQEWFFTVRPSDGTAFGGVAVSLSVTIANQPPVGTKPKLVSSNSEDPLIFTSSDDITAEFSFTDGDSDNELGSIYTFFVNGLQVKSGTSDTMEAKEEDEEGNKFIAPGNTIRVDIIPSDGLDFGEVISTESVTVTGSAPKVTDVSVLPIKATAASSLLVKYKFTSIDGSKDQSRIAWFSDDQRKTDFDNLIQVGRGNLKPGEKWYAIVTPFGGNIEGEPVKSNVVLVQN